MATAKKTTRKSTTKKDLEAKIADLEAKLNKLAAAQDAKPAETAPKHDFHSFFLPFLRILQDSVFWKCYLHFNCEFVANIHTCFWCVFFEVRGTCKMLKKTWKIWI